MERERNTGTAKETGAKHGGIARGWVAAGVIAVLAVGGIGAAGAMGAADGMGRYMADGMGRYAMNAGFQHGGRFAGRGLGRVMEAVEVTTEQEVRIWTIIAETRAELRPMMHEFRDAGDTVVEILSAETIDRAAVENLRAERLAAIEEASKAMTSALVEALEVLTPEQRAGLAEHLRQRKSERRW